MPYSPRRHYYNIQFVSYSGTGDVSVVGVNQPLIQRGSGAGVVWS